MLFWASSTKYLTHEELGLKNLGSQFDVAGNAEICRTAQQDADLLKDI